MCKITFWGNNVTYGKFRTNGVPYISVAIGGKFRIGENLFINNTINSNPIGSYSRCTFFVDKGASLIIGKNLGISQSAINCKIRIVIGNNVKIGGGSYIYDSDFHSLDAKLRLSHQSDFSNTHKSPILIGNNVFVGAHSIILKGVTIGDNSIVGAGSVVTKNIPTNEIWAGNPAKFIRKIY